MDNHTLNHTAGEKESELDTIDLYALALDFFRIAKKIWWLFVVLIALGVGGLGIVEFVGYSPLYRCEATFTVTTDNGNSYSNTTANQMSETFPYILDSTYFQSVLLDELGQDTLNGTITANTISGSNMVTMRVDSPSVEDAQNILEAALQVYPEVSRFVLGEITFHLLDDISVPTEPYNRPSLKHILGYGGLCGLFVACCIVLLMALFSKTAKSNEEIENWFSMENLGVLPEVKQKARKNSTIRRHISALDKRMPHGFRESTQSLDVRVRTILEKNNSKMLLVTSTMAGEGKSTVAINLAEQMAKNGYNVLLVDLDLRKQQDAALLNNTGGKSVAEVLQSEPEEQNFIRQLDNGIYFWGGDKTCDKPIAVLRNNRLFSVLKELRAQMDYIILDTPPCGLIQDAAMLADLADAILFVVGYDRVTRSDISEALSMLDARNAKIIGYVMNKFPQSGSGRYGYGYGKYGYGRYGYGRYGYGRYGYGGYASSYDTTDRKGKRKSHSNEQE